MQLYKFLCVTSEYGGGEYIRRHPRKCHILNFCKQFFASGAGFPSAQGPYSHSNLFEFADIKKYCNGIITDKYKEINLELYWYIHRLRKSCNGIRTLKVVGKAKMFVLV